MLLPLAGTFGDRDEPVALGQAQSHLRVAVAHSGACSDLSHREATHAAYGDLFPDDEQDGPLAFRIAARQMLREGA